MKNEGGLIFNLLAVLPEIPEIRPSCFRLAAIIPNLTISMTTKPGMSVTRGLIRRWTLFLVNLAWFVVPFQPASSEDFLLEFESPEPSWKVFLPPQGMQVAIHERRRNKGKVGGAEFIRLNATREHSLVRLEHLVPPATVLDELEASLWFRSSQEGFELGLKIILPDVQDPETKTPLTISITGDRYTTADQWQQLKCRTSDRAISDKLRLLRKLRQMAINPKVMFVERVTLEGPLSAGLTDLQIDNLALTPLVRHQSRDARPATVMGASSPIQPVSQSTADPIPTEPRSNLPVRFQMHRLNVEGKPFFPRIVAGHGERPDVFADAGINVVWLQDYENTSTTAALRNKGLWVTAPPPYAKGSDGEPLDSENADLMPFQANTSPVLFWMLGARMTPDGRPRLTSWTNQIRNADRRFNKRPIAADVIENERLCSRHVDLLGISRHVVNTGCTFADYRDWMIERRDQAWPDTFCWTWIQTEPAPAFMDLARQSASPPMLEPEQIRMQVYAALAAGCRGLGYWTTTPLDHDSPAAKERLLVLTQLNMELDLFGQLITSGGTPQLVTFKIDAPRNENSPHAPKPAKPEPVAANRSGSPPPRKPQKELRAALIRSELGQLMLPMWLEDNGQVVPGPMAAVNVPIIIPGGGETAAAWEITTTGQLRHLDRMPAVGGVQIKLPRLDQTAAILMTTNQAIVEEMNQKIAAIQDRSAHLCVELARLKLERIRLVNQTLQELGVARSDAPIQLGSAKLCFDKAEASLRSQQYGDARQNAAEALQFARSLQRMEWEQAVNRLPNITTNPWALSYQSLPDYWRLTRQIEQISSFDSLENLLPSGEFEDISTLVAEHWKPEPSTLETVQSSAELHHVAKQGKSSLRLLASPIAGEVVPKFVPKPLVTVVSPGINVQAGQLVRITGWAKIPTALVGSTDGALIYDSLLGKAGAVRLKASQDWKPFELLRPVPESQDMTITLSLLGVGELLIDDLRVTAVELGPEVPPPSHLKSSITPTKFSRLDIRRLNPLPKRQ